MSDTVYRIVADGGDHGFLTDDVEEAESWSEAGADVYAVSGGMGMNRRDIALMDVVEDELVNAEVPADD